MSITETANNERMKSLCGIHTVIKLSSFDLRPLDSHSCSDGRSRRLVGVALPNRESLRKSDGALLRAVAEVENGKDDVSCAHSTDESSEESDREKHGWNVREKR